MEEKIKRYRYSEIFGNTIQGEGHFTGHPTIWIRWWGCNFECNSFGQKQLDKPDSFDLPYSTFDVSKIKKMEDLPVWHTGCDSSYSWSNRFVKLAKLESAKEICDRLELLMKNQYNPTGIFQHPNGNDIHLAFTGGEPMMSQHACMAVLKELQVRDNLPNNITIETNGTQELKDNFKEYLENSIWGSNGDLNYKLFWSCSPKLYSSGEKWADAIKPEVIKSYANLSDFGQLKYVVDGSERTWHEVEEATKLYREQNITWPVWIMPVGADLEMQNEHAANIAHEAIQRGYNIAARVHTYLFGNAIGT
jgi:7-carboxy-7-deazaguanine synthase